MPKGSAREGLGGVCRSPSAQSIPRNLPHELNVPRLAWIWTMSFPLLHSHALLRRLLAKNAKTGPAVHYLYLLGETTQVRHDTDRELPFRQVRSISPRRWGRRPGGHALTEHTLSELELAADS